MAAKDRALAAKLRITVDPQSLQQVKQQLGSILKQTAEDFAKAGFKDPQQLVQMQQLLTATAQRQTAEEKLAQAKSKTADAAEKAAQREERALERVNAAAEKAVRNEQRILDQQDRKAQASEKAAARQAAASEKAAAAAASAAQKEAAAVEAASQKMAAAQSKAAAQAQAAAQKAAQTKVAQQQSAGTPALQSLFAGINASSRGLSFTGGGLLNPNAIANALGGSSIGSMMTGGMGAALAGIPLILGAAREVQRMYIGGQDFLRSVSQTQREVGLTKDQASVARSFTAFTQDPNSPFANITVAQVQAKLQETAMLQQGLIEENPQLLKFRDALDSVGISALNVKGEVKDVTSFILELSKAAQGLTPGQYAQLSTGLGGLFGKDFAAIYGTDPKLLEQLATFSVKISDDMLNKANERTAAIQMAVNAEQQFALAATAAITPIDIQINKLKQAALLNLAGSITTDPFEKARLNALSEAATDPSKVGVGLAKYMDPEEEMQVRVDFLSKRLDELAKKREEMTKIANATPLSYADVQAGRQAPNALEVAAANVDLIQVNAEYERTAAALGLARDAQRDFTDKKAADAEMQATLTKRTLDYKDALKELKGAIEDGIKAEEQRAKANENSAKSFGNIYDDIEQAGKGYDNFYEQLADVRKKIDDLDAKAAQKVVYFKSPTTGKAVDPNNKDFQKLLDDISKDQAQALDKSGQLDDLQRRLQAKLDTEAAQASKKPGGGTLTVGDQIAIENYQEKIRLMQESGGAGTSYASVVNEQIADRKLQERAQALGFGSIEEFMKATGQAPPTPATPVRSREDDARLEAVRQEFGNDFSQEGLTKAFRKRGLTQKEAEERAELVKKERSLTLEDRGQQFDVIKSALAEYMQQLAPMKKENETAAEAQQRFNEAMQAGSDSLGDFSRNAGLFDSVGFQRAVLESSLAVKLSKGGFGEGADAVKGYTKAMETMYQTINNPMIQNVLSGKNNLSQIDAMKMGLVKPEEFTSVQTGDDALERGVYKNVKSTKTYSPSEVMQLIAQKQAIDISGGVQKMFDDQVKNAKEQGSEFAKAADEAMKEVFENPYNIKFELDNQSLEDAKVKLGEMVAAANGDGFKAPSDFKTKKQQAEEPPPPPPGAGAGPYSHYYGTSTPPSTAAIPTATNGFVGPYAPAAYTVSPSPQPPNKFAPNLQPQNVKPGDVAAVPTAGVQVIKIEIPKDFPAPKAEPMTSYIPSATNPSSYVPVPAGRKAPPVSITLPPAPGATAPSISASGVSGAGTTTTTGGMPFYPTPDGKPPVMKFTAELPASEQTKVLQAVDKTVSAGQMKLDGTPFQAKGDLDKATGPKMTSQLFQIVNSLQQEANARPIIFRAQLIGVPTGNEGGAGDPNDNPNNKGKSNNNPPPPPPGYQPQYAAGGPVYAGQPVTVGEEGRETFIPTSNGIIIDAGLTRRMMWESTKSFSPSYHNSSSAVQNINYDVKVDAPGNLQPAAVADATRGGLERLFISNDPNLRRAHRRVMPS